MDRLGSAARPGRPTEAHSTEAQSTEVLAGSIERITVHNPANGFCVLCIKARGHRDLVTVVGHAAEISAGEWFTLSGTWVNDRQHGLQFRASFLRSSAPTTAEGTEKYLGSGMIHGIGFRTADAIAGRLGIAPEAMIRLRAGLHFALLEASGNGHCGLPTAELLQVAADLLALPGGEGERTPLDASLIEAALQLEVAKGALVANTLGGEAAIFLSHLHRDERRIAEALRLLAGGAPPWQSCERGAIDPAVAIAWVEQRLGLDLAASQKEAVRLALASKVLVITGGPGVVKTTLINAILQILAARRLRLHLCAPTAHAVNAGILPDLHPPAGDQQSDVYFVPADTPEQAVGLILRLVADRIPARFGLHPIQQVQVLCPMARGGCGARGWRFAPGDKVMEIANDYEKEVFNGDLGTIDAIDPDNSELTVLVEGRPVVYGWGELDTLVPAYACTTQEPGQ